MSSVSTDEGPDPQGPQPLKKDPPTGADQNLMPAEHPARVTSGRVVALGLYLLVMALLSVGGLSDLLMAESDPISIECHFDPTLEKCKENPVVRKVKASAEVIGDVVEQPPSATPTPSPTATAPSPSPTTTEINATGNADTNKANTSASPKTSPSATPKPSPSLSATPLRQQFARISIPPQLVYGLGLLTADSYLIWLVIFAGMLGAVARVIYSFYKHLGFGDFILRWVWFYVLLPFFGPVLSLGIYFIIRGGFYTSPYGQELTLNLFSFAALAFLTGLFSENAMEKLHQVAITLLADTPPKVAESKQIMQNRKTIEENKPRE